MISRSLAGLALLALGSCTTPTPVVPQTLIVTKTVYVPWVWPAGLKSCAPTPAPVTVPHIDATDPHAGSKVALYISALRQSRNDAAAAADDCRATLAAAVQANAAPQLGVKP